MNFRIFRRSFSSKPEAHKYDLWIFRKFFFGSDYLVFIRNFFDSYENFLKKAG